MEAVLRQHEVVGTALERQVGDVPDRETDAADAMKFDPPLCRGDRLGRRVEAVERGEQAALRGEKLEPAAAAVEGKPGALARDRQLAEQVEQPMALARSPRDERLDVLGNQQARVGPADAARRRSGRRSGSVGAHGESLAASLV